MSFIKSVDTEEKTSLISDVTHLETRNHLFYSASSSVRNFPFSICILRKSFFRPTSSSRHKLGENMADKVSCDDDDEPWLEEDYEPARKTFPLVLLQLIDILTENTFAINSFLAYCDAFFFSAFS